MVNLKNQLRKVLYANKITRTICQQRNRLNDWYTVAFPFYKKKLRYPKAVFLVMTPEHGNLGDHAIAKAEIQLLEKNNIPYIEITGAKIEQLKQQGFLGVMNGRPILVNGGGNLGTLWFNVEEAFRQIIQSNPDSQIICLPNTIYYEESEWGKKELEKSIEIYNAHPNLTLYAREKTSYSIMSAIYKNVKLIPDMVLSLDYSDKAYERKGCLLCLRNDCERTLLKEQEDIIYNQIQKLFGDKIKKTDMVVKYRISIDEREVELEKKLDEFLHAELVVTDRLHAMIFSVITGTPCIVVNSKSPKVMGCYEWIKSLEYIKFADEVSQISILYKQIPKRRFIYENKNYAVYYKILEKDIKRKCKNFKDFAKDIELPNEQDA